MNSWEALMGPGSGIYLLSAAEDRPPMESRAGRCVCFVDGKKCATTQTLFSEFAGQLSFPSYFGRNWDAFDECMSDLHWLPCQSHLIIILDAASLLQLGPDLGILLNVLRDVAGEWATVFPGESYKVAFVLAEHEKASFCRALEESKISYRTGE